MLETQRLCLSLVKAGARARVAMLKNLLQDWLQSFLLQDWLQSFMSASHKSDFDLFVIP